MISHLFRRRRPYSGPTAPPEAPAGSRVYAIGDIHGCLGLLKTLHERIAADAERHAGCRRVIVYLGDYVDRGLDSRGVIDLLLSEPLPGFERIHLKGNHEDTVLRFLEDEQVGPGWLAYGGAPTLYSYGIQPPDSATDADGLARAREELAQKLPPDHLAFLRELVLTHEEGGYLFVHAGLRPAVALESQDPEDLMWIRDEFLRSDEDFGRVVVHGHSITDEPEVRVNRIGIDTGAFASGRLTCLVLDGPTRSIIST
jgi:serine/threonine protein phosphatase 1